MIKKNIAKDVRICANRLHVSFSLLNKERLKLLIKSVLRGIIRSVDPVPISKGDEKGERRIKVDAAKVIQFVRLESISFFSEQPGRTKVIDLSTLKQH